MIAALLALGVLAACSLLASALPPFVALPLAVLAAGRGAWLARREQRRPQRQLLWPSGDAPVTLDGQKLLEVELRWRGPLAFLHGRDEHGRSHRLAWWPDTLPPARRRELRLASMVNNPARNAQSVAP